MSVGASEQNLATFERGENAGKGVEAFEM